MPLSPKEEQKAQAEPEKKEDLKTDNELDKKKKAGDSDETDEDDIPKNLKDEYDWRRQRDIDLAEDEFCVADVNIAWSGENVLSIQP